LLALFIIAFVEQYLNLQLNMKLWNSLKCFPVILRWISVQSILLNGRLRGGRGGWAECHARASCISMGV